jgi:hypothetical protein
MRATCPTHLVFLDIVTFMIFEEENTVNPSQNRLSDREWIAEIRQYEFGV